MIVLELNSSWVMINLAKCDFLTSKLKTLGYMVGNVFVKHFQK